LISDSLEILFHLVEEILPLCVGLTGRYDKMGEFFRLS